MVLDVNVRMDDSIVPLMIVERELKGPNCTNDTSDSLPTLSTIIRSYEDKLGGSDVIERKYLHGFRCTRCEQFPWPVRAMEVESYATKK